MLAISAASALVSYDQQSQMADAQAEGIKRQRDLQLNDLARQGEQQREADAAQMNEAAKRSARDMAAFDVMAGEYGSGNSMERARATMGVQAGENMATLAGNARTAAGENSFSSLATKTRSSAQLASIAQPSAIGTALKIGGAYANYSSMQPAVKADPNAGAFAIHKTNRSIGD